MTELPDFFIKNKLEPFSISEQKILGAISQSEIAEKTDLSQQSISRLVKKLLGKNTIHVKTKTKGGRGQPSLVLRLTPEFAYTFGIEIMTDSFSVVLIDFSGTVLEKSHRLINKMTRDVVIPEIKEIIDSCIAKRKIKSKNIFGIGMGISGYCMEGHGCYNTPAELDDWDLIDLNDILTEQLQLNVWVENDANAAAVGELMMGAGRYYDNFVYVYISLGIGGGVVINGELIRGHHGNVGEIGLVLPSRTHQAPTLESLYKLVVDKGMQFNSLQDFLTNFDPDWHGVEKCLAMTHNSFSKIVSALSAILDTQAIILGGRIPHSLANRVIKNIQIYDDTRHSEPRPKPELLVSESHSAAPIGAAALPLKKYFFGGQK